MPSKERLALAVLYFSTGGDHWKSKYGWLSAAHHGNWFGVTIASSTNYVSILSLHDNKLSESLPTQIGHFTSLTSLDLYHNHLSGTIPTQIGQFTSLNRLILHTNAFDGIIPEQIGHLTSLTSLELYSNALGGTIPTQIGQLTFLNTTLYLHHNDLRGTIPTQIGKLKSLTFLDLSYNALSGTIPIQILQLTSLIGLYLDNNDLTGPIPDEIVSKIMKQTLTDVIGECAIYQSCPSTTMNSASNWFIDPDNHPDDISMDEQVWKVRKSQVFVSS